MGVSTLASYRNSHLFEVVGLKEDLCANSLRMPRIFRAEEFGRFVGRLCAHAPRGVFWAPMIWADAGLYSFRKARSWHANSPEIVRRMHAHVKAA